MSAENEMIIAESSGEGDPESQVGAADTEATDKTPAPQSKPIPAGARNSVKNNARSGKPAADQVVAWFAACPRCSYFLAAYRLEYGMNALATAVEKSRVGWLALDWNQSMCKLVRKSYGSQLDIDCYHYDGSCPECRRQFVYRTLSDDHTMSGRFRIELKPRAGR